MKLKSICITGIDGSGKTTLIAEIAKRTGARVVTIWDLMKTPDSQAKPMFRSKEEVDSYLKSLHFPARTHFLFHCMSEAVSRALAEKSDLIVYDAYWYKYWASEVAMGGDRETALSLASGMADPDLIFFIDLPAAEALARKKRYSGYESGYTGTDEGYVRFQGAAYENLKSIMKEKGARFLNGAHSVEENLRVCLQAIGVKP